MSGQVYVPRDVILELREVTDTFEYNKRDRTELWNAKWCKNTKLAEGLQDIPEPVLDMKVVISRNKRLDAVVVVEHRNLEVVLIDKKYAIKHVLIVMVCAPQRYSCLC